jgi:chorismate mutase
MAVRGIRGATLATDNTRDAILAATRELLVHLIEANGILPEAIAAAFFTTTTDLDAEFPAVAARQLGWTEVALMCGHEMQVPGALGRCIRVLVLLNTDLEQSAMRFVYINGAEALRITTPPPIE